MKNLAIRYTNARLSARLIIGMGTAILLNACYCLIYRYTSGNPATLFEAFSWGAINIAPWIAAFEIGRSRRDARTLALVFTGAFIASILLDMAAYPAWPDAFDVTKRIPGVMIAAAGIFVFQRTGARVGQSLGASVNAGARLPDCHWAQSAGNYVELHRLGEPSRTFRGTLAGLVQAEGRRMVRIHRRYAVCPDFVARIEPSSVLLKDGRRLPIGDRYRENLTSQGSLVPSSQED